MSKSKAEVEWLEHTERSIQNTLECISATPNCNWCKNPEKRVYATGLCGHCYRINRQIARMESRVSSPTKNKAVVDWELRVVKKKRDLARSEGRRYGEIHKQDVDDLRLELAFSELGRYLIGRSDLFHGENSFISMALPNHNQRRYVYYLISRLLREVERKWRTNLAESELLWETERASRQSLKKLRGK